VVTGVQQRLGLDVVLWLQAYSSPLLDILAQVIHVLGAPATYMLFLLPLLLWYRRVGAASAKDEMYLVPTDYNRVYQWIFALVMVILFTDVLKLLFQAPRPYQVAPELVRLLVIQRSSYGLPSGHVAVALTMSGLAAIWGGRRWLWILAGLYTLLVGWSRMYVGVHYPQDVIAGILVGGFALWFSLRYFERSLRAWRHTPWPARLALVIAMLVLVINVPGI
jgi:membrane-associated phospholipid phosphatase